jgi:hypothetical protein
MIENRLFFLCETCGDAVPIAIRSTGPYVTPRHLELNPWFRKHALCGGNYDHFSVVYGIEPDGNAEVVVAQTIPAQTDESTH